MRGGEQGKREPEAGAELVRSRSGGMGTSCRPAGVRRRRAVSRLAARWVESGSLRKKWRRNGGVFLRSLTPTGIVLRPLGGGAAKLF